MKKTQLGLLAVLLGIGYSTTGFTHDSIGFSLNIGQPFYYGPPPVYYSSPVVYYEPRPDYREYYDVNYGTYYYPNDVRYYDNDDWKEHHERHRHHEHDDDDDD